MQQVRPPQSSSNTARVRGDPGQFPVQNLPNQAEEPVRRARPSSRVQTPLERAEEEARMQERLFNQQRAVVLDTEGQIRRVVEGMEGELSVLHVSAALHSFVVRQDSQTGTCNENTEKVKIGC